MGRGKLESHSHRDQVLTFYEHHVGSDLLEEFQRLFRLGKVVPVKALRNLTKESVNEGWMQR